MEKGFRVVASEVHSSKQYNISDKQEQARGNHTSSHHITSSDTERERAESQVEEIAKLFGQGNDQTAQKYLEELVASQTGSNRDHSHVVKSLCNIANKCRGRGRRDIGLQCLNRALKFQTGIDALAYIQIGNALRDLKEYDQAIACYKEAKRLDRGDKSDQIRVEIIRTSVARGDYEEARNMYLEIPGLEDQPYTLSALGTLYRRMGNLSEARRAYQKVLNLDPTFHAARAGLAEALKQNGKHHKALARYRAIERDYPNLELSSSRVYSLAESYLLRSTHQFNNALLLLTELLKASPKDCDIHLQLAKLHMLMGKENLAKQHFQDAQGQSLDSLEAQLFIRATGKLIPSSLVTSNQPASNDLYLPEDLDLANCNQALLAIEQSEYLLAKSVVESPRYVDRLHADFGAVLGYHAKKKIAPTFNYKSDLILCRVAKRGYRELRYSIRAIADGDFRQAEIFERRLCLLAA